MGALFQQQLTTNSDYLHSLAYKLTGDHFNADDLYQDTVVKILANEERFDIDTSFKSWSQTIMRNTFINYYRSKARRRTDATDTNDSYFANVITATTSNGGDTQIDYEFLTHIVEELEDNYRTIFQMYVEGYPYEEMSELLGITVPLLRTRVFTAKRLLQYRLQGLRLAA
jgi:RNA polymerase sigma-70 factor (ECF subfamily)